MTPSHNYELLRLTIGTPFHIYLNKLFTFSLRINPNSIKARHTMYAHQTSQIFLSASTSYRPINLLSTIMKLFERVIGKRLRKKPRRHRLS